jgi:hypothetical protein
MMTGFLSSAGRVNVVVRFINAARSGVSTPWEACWHSSASQGVQCPLSTTENAIETVPGDKSGERSGVEMASKFRSNGVKMALKWS